MASNHFLADLLAQRWERYIGKLDGCRVEFSEMAVHDLRVATRRLLAALELIRALEPEARVKKLRRALKTQLDGFDNLRDAQVMLAEATAKFADLPEIGPFQRYLQKRETRLLRAAEKRVEAFKMAAIEKRMDKLARMLAAAAEVDLNLRLYSALDAVYLTVQERYQAIDPAQPGTIHHLRVAFKKFRYMLEGLQPALPDFPETQLKRMQNYQTLMGNFHDLEVFLARLGKFAARRKQFESQPVRRVYEQALTQALAAYLGKKEKLETFWRATPESNFPWKDALQGQEAK